jgi:hypothetical protein
MTATRKRKKPTRSQREALRTLKTANARAEARGHTKKGK